MKHYFGCIIILLLLTITNIVSIILKKDSLSVLLLPSSGCYSHDVMMRQFGENINNNESVYWFQLLIYDFSINKKPFPKNWIPLIFNRTTVQNQAIISSGISLFWEMNIPFDLTRPWDLRDHLLQECLTSLFSKMNTPTIQFSNWPLSDGYISSLNIPAMPSSVPKTGTLFSGKKMSFLERNMNFIFNLVIIFTRTLQSLSMLFDFNCNLFEIEAKHLFYVSRSEMIIEPIRPINNRIKYFGGNHNKDKYDYINEIEKLKNLNVTGDVLWNDLDNNKFILVTFGSISNVKNMPIHLLKIFLNTFKNCKYIVIWQSNTNHHEITSLTNIKIPSNVKIVKWIPLTLLFNHRNLKYVICHGGINTINELVYFKIPIVGIPLQGDQSSNLQRLVDLNVCKLITIRQVWNGELKKLLQIFEDNLNSFRERSNKIGSMVEFHKLFLKDEQVFWIQWSRRHGKKLHSKLDQKYFDMKMKSTIEMYMLQDVLIYLTFCIIITIICYKN
ncbi:UDP-glucuronosyl/UDP-glucosyltransferase family-containing protein [Strongyloides ratti]|uniref:glucuronosyltransferase n=1 Tax=Strongyloides ratti TaxID=34506 RepID=A0A090KUN3_STRRB|nr:UDP-glucuronosyl/UDP-glucosyltransferase family-containing protein [Strongyloides ratti]CEF61185.1 UDP-glucuronosyl/UDP-glucosyltransferase family-containing protein [Strongyloides ratti]